MKRKSNRAGARPKAPSSRGLISPDQPARLAAAVQRAISETPVTDIHTHLYDPAFGGLLLWGIDELLVYHYLVAEVMRQAPLEPARFWALSRQEQADFIWKQLFLENSPISEACRGVITCLRALGLDPARRDLPALRQWFSKRRLPEHLSRCLEAAGIDRLYMTNSPFDDAERPIWQRGFPRDERFAAALRIDSLLIEWKSASAKLRAWGYRAGVTLNPRTFAEVRRFLDDWTDRMGAHYLMVSMPPDFAYPDGGPTALLLEQAVLPHCRDRGLPLAFMPGVKRALNPDLRLAGDGVGRSDLDAYERLMAAAPENKFVMTVLSRENQHQLCVMARKFPRLHIFGCWWFMNNPGLVDETTRMRIEMLGTSVTLQHSDARVLEQVVYKWRHTRETVGRVLAERYAALAASGWAISEEEIRRDVRKFFGGSFAEFLAR